MRHQLAVYKVPLCSSMSPRCITSSSARRGTSTLCLQAARRGTGKWSTNVEHVQEEYAWHSHMRRLTRRSSMAFYECLLHDGGCHLSTGRHQRFSPEDKHLGPLSRYGLQLLFQPSRSTPSSSFLPAVLVTAPFASHVPESPVHTLRYYL
jgi:hypothetical protein